MTDQSADDLDRRRFLKGVVALMVLEVQMGHRNAQHVVTERSGNTETDH